MNQQQRAKVYLHKDNGWEEICIAFIQIVHGEGVSFIRGILQQQIQANKSLVTFAHLNVNKEEWCVNLKVSSENQYEKHGDNIIQWEENDLKTEIALSFIDSKYTAEFWQQLQNGRRHFRYDDLESTYPIIPSHQNLEAVQLQISDNPELIVHKITNDHQFLEALKKIFEEAEQTQHIHILEQLHYVIRSLIYLKNEAVLKSLLCDKFYMTLFGIMECTYSQYIDHSENKGPQRVSYREFLTKQSKFHQITALDPEIMEKIHFNYRLSYLKESVMAYYLYIEDPIYIQFNQFINQNNQHILDSLLINHRQQFQTFLSNFTENLEVNCKFINEFFLSFRQFMQIQTLNEAFIESLRKTDLLKTLHQVISDGTTQYVCFTTLQLTIMVANTNMQYLQDFLKANTTLFWDNMEQLLFSNMVSTHNMIIDIVQYVCTNEAVIGQGKDWLKKCLSSHLNSSAVIALQQIVQQLCISSTTISQDLIILSNHILNTLNNKDKFLLIPALKHFKYISTTQVSNILKPYCDIFIQLSTSKRLDGILEGQIRDILKSIKSNTSLCQHIVLLVRSMNLQDHPLYVNISKEYPYVHAEESQKVRMQMEEHRYYELDDSDEHQPQITAQLTGEEIKLDFNKIVRKRVDDDDDVEAMPFVNTSIIFGDNIAKRVKLDDD